MYFFQVHQHRCSLCCQLCKPKRIAAPSRQNINHKVCGKRATQILKNDQTRLATSGTYNCLTRRGQPCAITKLLHLRHSLADKNLGHQTATTVWAPSSTNATYLPIIDMHNVQSCPNTSTLKKLCKLRVVSAAAATDCGNGVGLTCLPLCLPNVFLPSKFVANTLKLKLLERIDVAAICVAFLAEILAKPLNHVIMI